MEDITQTVETHYCFYCITKQIPELTPVRVRSYDVNEIIDEPVSGCIRCDMDLYRGEYLTMKQIKDYIKCNEKHIEKVRELIKKC